MKIKTPDADVGVIVGRFQTSELHDGHLQLIQSVIDRHDKVIIFLGLSPIPGTTRNPLDFEARKQMILSAFPNVSVLYIKDVPDDKAWSKRLDEQIKDLITPTQSVVLYGSRDSFIPHYFGNFQVIELETPVYYSSTEDRRKIGKSVKNSPEFRKGVIWATQNRYPTCFPTVDVAIIDYDKSRVLLAKKAIESKHRFVGGFVDPYDETFEDAAEREVREETGLEIANLKYIGSAKINDWRYRSEVDKIKTMFFAAQYVYGSPTAMDDIDELRWFEFDEIKEDIIVDTHHPLIHLFHKHLEDRPVLH